MTKHLYHWHWRIGLFAVIAIVLWCFSGVLHPIMNRFQPKPVKLDAVQTLAVGEGRSANEVLAQQGIHQVAELNLLSWKNRNWYQVRLPGIAVRQYFNAVDGTALAEGDRLYAETLARDYLGEHHANIVESRLLTEFDGEYADVNRLLPVWQVRFERDDGMRVYIDTGTGHMATLVDNLKAFSSTEFSLLHRWDWLNGMSPWLRVASLSIMLVANLAVVVMGIWIYALRWNNFSPKWGLRRVHRIGGMTLSVAALAFALSGLYHLWNKQVRGDNASRIQFSEASMAVNDLASNPWHLDSDLPAVRRVSLVSWSGQYYWRFEPAMAMSNISPMVNSPAEKSPVGDPEHRHHADQAKDISHVRYFSAVDGAFADHAEQGYAKALLHEALPNLEPPEKLETVSRFSDEYGFLYKRLPVSRAQFADGQAIYVDTADRKIAAVIQTPDRAERWVFSNIHKLNFLDPYIGKDWRDVVAATLAALLIATTLIGTWLYLRARMKRSKKSV